MFGSYPRSEKEVVIHLLVCLQLRLQAAKVSGVESRELLRAGWDDAIKTHLKDSAPLPLSLTEQHRQVRQRIQG